MIWIGLIRIAVLVLLVGGAIVRAITNPLTRPSQALEAMSTGAYSQTLRTGRKDEIGKLEVSFERMAEQLQSNRELQQEFILQLEQNKHRT